ncbi:acyltransferase, partial [Streptomyces sp. SID7982]|nr:acyltransferase [Streptomyces sp. SID7982]
LVGGMVAARSWDAARQRGVPYGRWVGGRLARLFRPVAAVLVVWTLAAGAMLTAGVGESTVRALGKLVWS